MVELVMLAPRGFGKIAEQEMVMARLNQYLFALDTISNSPRHLTVILGAENYHSSSKVKTEGRVKLLTISHPTRNPVKFAYHALRKSREMNLRPGVLLASDIRFALLASLVYRLFSPSIFFQVQVHGMYDSLTPTYLKCFRLPYLFVVAKLSDSIRFVSNIQYQSFPLFFRKTISSTVIAPIPYFYKLKPRVVANNLNSIGFVGRFHHERGLDKFLQVMQEVQVRAPIKPIVIVGDGAEKATFLSNLRLVHSGPQIELGWLNSSELDSAWSDIGTLLVTAPMESFGVTMREALLHGVRVVALQNMATLAIERQFPSAIFTSKSISELAEKAIEWSTTRIDFKDWELINKQLYEEEQENLLLMARSWAVSTEPGLN